LSGERDSVRVLDDLQAYSIEAVLERAEAWRRRNPKVLEVTYDETYGFPSRVFVDPDPRVSLDDTTLTVTDFAQSSTLR
jgi:hypothetical protein